MITIKCVQPYFGEVYCGNKTFEIRKNDRPYKVDSIVRLKCYDFSKNSYNGYYVDIMITYILKEFVDALDENYIIFSFKVMGKGRYL